MHKDPIVEETRRAGDRLAREYEYDLHRLCEHLREVEREFEGRIWHPESKADKPIQEGLPLLGGPSSR